MFKRNLVGFIFLASLATNTTVLAMDRDARVILSGGGSYTSIEDSDITSVGAGAMVAIDRAGAFAIDFSAAYLEASGDADEDGSQLVFGLSWFLSEHVKFRMGVFYTWTDWDSSVTIIDAQRRTLSSFWESEGESLGGEFEIKIRLIPASEAVSPYLFAGIGISKPEIEAKNGTTYATAPNGYYFKQTRTRYNQVNLVPIEYDLSTVFSARLGVGIDLALTRNVGLNVYGLVGMSRYDHTVTVWDVPFSESDSTSWSLGASIKWYWDRPGNGDQFVGL